MREHPIILLVWWTMACQPQGSGFIDPVDPNPSGTLTNTTTTTTTTTPTDTGTPTTTTTPPEPFDCATIPALPATFHTHTGYSTAEDFDFDADGYAIAMYSGNLTGKDQVGDVKIVSPNVANESSGTRALGTGDFVVANVWSGEIVLVDGTTGGKSTLMGGFSYPNGVEVDALDNVYVADQNRGTVTRVNAYNAADNEEIVSGLNNPNGVIISADGLHMYVGSFGGGMIYQVDALPGGGWGPATILYEAPGPDNGFDGINVDICGNVYFTEWIVGKIRRIEVGTGNVELVAVVPSSWIPNLRWGNDVGGWANDVLYVSDRDQGRIFGLELGVPGKPPLVP